MRPARSPGIHPPRRHLPTRIAHTVVVCLPAHTPTTDLPARARAAVATRGLPTAGVLPHFAVRTRRAGTLLVDCWRGRTGGGPIRLLDLEGMRRAAVTAADAEWQVWRQVVAGTKPANPFWWYADKHRGNPEGYPLDVAQCDYRAQPRILAMTAYNALPHRPGPLPTASVEALQAGYPTYVNLAFLAAVPGDGLVTEHGGWLSTRGARLADQLAYLNAAGAHLAGLRPDTRLVAVACPS